MVYENFENPPAFDEVRSVHALFRCTAVNAWTGFLRHAVERRVYTPQSVQQLTKIHTQTLLFGPIIECLIVNDECSGHLSTNTFTHRRLHSFSHARSHRHVTLVPAVHGF